jgi:class 3 adenylate cyclase
VHAGENYTLADGEIHGIAVRMAERMLAHAGAGEVLATQTVRDAVYGSSLAFTARGDVELAGAGTWNLFIAIPG